MTQVQASARPVRAYRTSRSTASLPPEAIGRWRPVRLLGEGRMTRVYQARPDGDHARHAGYAVKVLRRRLESDPAAVACMRREALAASEVAHPHLVPLLAAQVRQPPFHLVWPKLLGAALSARLARDEPLPLPTALAILRQTAQALAALHTAGWVHGDVKPSNVFVSKDGHATLIDLGFARRVGEGASQISGTPRYMPPELSAARAVDGRADLYSLGVTMYEVLARRPPFEAAGAAGLAMLHRSAAPKDLRSFLPHAPREIAHLAAALLSKDPFRRPQSAKELIERLLPLEIMTFADRYGRRELSINAKPPSYSDRHDT